MSESAKDLISKMLVKSTKRPSMEEILSHKWLKESSKDLADVKLKLNLKELEKF